MIVSGLVGRKVFSSEVSRGEKMLYSGTDPESHITEYTYMKIKLWTGKSRRPHRKVSGIRHVYQKLRNGPREWARGCTFFFFFITLKPRVE